MPAPAYRRITDLPEIIPVFPLSGALLLPRWQLPLNIFEPRYLNMLDDAMAGERMIGMVQPVGGDKASPDIAAVGCAGRVTSFSETSDGRYLISLTGIARFRVSQELPATTPYRQVMAEWDAFADDLFEPDVSDLPSRGSLISTLRDYIERNAMSADWSTVEDAPIETLINALCAGCPFPAMEKQALLEAATLKDRCETLIALLEMDVPGSGKDRMQ